MSGLLVVGAREGSLGAQVAEFVLQMGWLVHTAGISGDEDSKMDILDGMEVATVLGHVQPEHVLCTVGINHPMPFTEMEWADNFSDALAINTFGPLDLLRAWLPYSTDESHFVVVSSNSAHIARTFSSSYCMSKAALSMGIRCAARELARVNKEAPAVYAWEFGLLAGTPMTAEVNAALGAEHPSRMVGMEGGIPVRSAAEAVVGMLLKDNDGLNGVTLRMDAGEQ